MVWQYAYVLHTEQYQQPPTDLMALEHKEKYLRVTKTDARSNLLTRWQSRWNQAESERWN